MPQIYVYRRAASDGANELADALGGRRWRDRISPLTSKVRPGDTVISWGEAFAAPGVRILNGGPIRSKLTDAETLRAANIATIETSRTRPAPTMVPAGPDPVAELWARLDELADDFINDEPDSTSAYRSAPRIRGIQELRDAATSLLDGLNRPAPVATTAAPAGEWLGRSSNHVGGGDLLRGDASDYFSKKETFVEEFRVHSFLGRSIRVGKKVHRTPSDITPFTGTPHAWIRSWDGGWKIFYDGVSANQTMRDLAHAAVRALNLDFGAVDIGKLADGTYKVIEVNRAPGLDGATIIKYAESIQKWMRGEWTATNQAETRPERTTRRAA